MITVGIDEVGRGSWAGPVVAGAVILNDDVPGLRDSKKLSKTQRVHLSEQIYSSAHAVGIGWVAASELDLIGLTAAVGLAMHRAVEQITTKFDEIIVDGNINYFPDDIRAIAVVKADDSVPAVSAASIVAKVARDSYMANVAHKKYPEYAFDKHVGYGTSLHHQMLRLYGVTELHRKTFKPVNVVFVERR